VSRSLSRRGHDASWAGKRRARGVAGATDADARCDGLCDSLRLMPAHGSVPGRAPAGDARSAGHAVRYVCSAAAA
jgi:hypothetical protein